MHMINVRGVLELKKKKDKEKNEETGGKKDSRGVYIPTEQEVIQKRIWSQIHQL